MFKFNTTYIVAAVFLLLIGCTDKEQQARSLGFSDAKEMQEMQFKGFKNKAAYALAQDQYNNIKNKKENLENYPRCAGSYEFIKCVADERKLITETEIVEFENKIAKKIQKSVDFAEAGTWEPIDQLTKFVHSI